MRPKFYPLFAALLVFLLGSVPAARAQVISTFAGGVVVEDQPATTTPLSQPRGLTVDRQGNLYIAETGAGLIRKVDAVTGIATIIAGGGTELMMRGRFPRAAPCSTARTHRWWTRSATSTSATRIIIAFARSPLTG